MYPSTVATQYPHAPPHGYGAPGPSYYQPPPPRKKRRWGWYIAGGFVLLFLIRRTCGPAEPPLARKARGATRSVTTERDRGVASATAPPMREQPPQRATTKVDDDPDNLLWLTKGGGYVGAATREKLDQVMDLIVVGDKTAFEKLLARDSIVFLIKPGLKVTLLDRAGTLSSQVKLRACGELVEFWTVREAIEKP